MQAGSGRGTKACPAVLGLFAAAIARAGAGGARTSAARKLLRPLTARHFLCQRVHGRAWLERIRESTCFKGAGYAHLALCVGIAALRAGGDVVAINEFFKFGMALGAHKIKHGHGIFLSARARFGEQKGRGKSLAAPRV